MCFENESEYLKWYRGLDRLIPVWKRGTIDPKTGVLYSFFGRHRTEWRQGTTVKPHLIRKPLKHKQEATAGLYFYTTEEPAAIVHDSWRNFGQVGKMIKLSIIILAEVAPEDVIAANYNGMTICCTKAKVIKALNPDDSRISRLTHWTEEADQIIKEKDKKSKEMQKEIRKWKEEREEHVECLEQMTKQLAQT